MLVSEHMEKLKELSEPYDVDFFRTTQVYSVLSRSRRVREKFGSEIESIWLSPAEFVERITKLILNETVGEMDFWLLVWGYEGSSKSSLCSMFYKNIMLKKHPDFWLKTVARDWIFLRDTYGKLVFYFADRDIRLWPIVVDDAHYVFGKYSGRTSGAMSTNQLARFNRDQQIIHLLNTQSPNQLWREIADSRVNVYIYTFGIPVMDESGNLIERWKYAAFWNLDNSHILRLDKDIFNIPRFWDKIITKYPPDFITRFDPLFPAHTDVWLEYRKLKVFFKKFYAFLNGMKITNDKHITVVFNMLEMIARKDISGLERYLEALPQRTLEQLAESGVVFKNPNTTMGMRYILHPILYSLVDEHREAILSKAIIRSALG